MMWRTWIVLNIQLKDFNTRICLQLDKNSLNVIFVVSNSEISSSHIHEPHQNFKCLRDWNNYLKMQMLSILQTLSYNVKSSKYFKETFGCQTKPRVFKENLLLNCSEYLSDKKGWRYIIFTFYPQSHLHTPRCCRSPRWGARWRRAAAWPRTPRTPPCSRAPPPARARGRCARSAAALQHAHTGDAGHNGST